MYIDKDVKLVSSSVRLAHSYYGWVDFVAGRETKELAADMLTNFSLKCVG